MDATSALLSAIADFEKNDPPFSRYTNPQLWNDPWISRRMLEAHLDPASDAASRRPAFIDESAAFIVRRFGLGPGKKVIDYGCGPGLYAQRLARCGARLAGIDLSANSLEYARARAAEEGLPIDYLQGDYQELDPPFAADLAILICFDYGVLGPERRKALLARMRRALKPGGRLFLDVCGLEGLRSSREIRRWEYEEGGFFGPDPYLHLYELKRYPEASAFAEKHLVIGDGGTRSFFCWNACFDEESLAAELAEGGFEVEDFYDDARGRRGGAQTQALAAAARAREG